MVWYNNKDFDEMPFSWAGTLVFRPLKRERTHTFLEEINKMKLISTNKVDVNETELEIRVDGEEFKAAYEESYKKNSQKINVHGFRKGKAPRGMVMKMVGAEYFCEGAIDATYQAAYKAALEESKLEPVDQASIEVTEVSVDGYTFKAKVTTYPEVKLEGYKGLEAKRQSNAVTEEEVKAELDRMADKNSRMVDIDDRAAELGDTANINFEGFVGETAFEGGKGENYDLVLGSGSFIPGFEDQIVGKTIGEEFDVNVKFPEEYHSEELKGKDATFKCKLNGLKKKEVPELDDEFAKDAGFDSLDELKKDVEGKIKLAKTERAEQTLEDDLCDAAAAKMEVVIPPVMIERKIDEMVQDFAFRLQQQGLSIDNYMKYSGGTIESFRESCKTRAEQQVKVTLALNYIAGAEKIEPTEEEINAEYQKLADTYSMEVEKVKQFVSVNQIATQLKLTKAIDFLKTNAVITDAE